jgi:hypothetical protein
MAAQAKLMRPYLRNILRREVWHGRKYGKVVEHLLNKSGVLKSSRKKGRGIL